MSSFPTLETNFSLLSAVVFAMSESLAEPATLVHPLKPRNSTFLIISSRRFSRFYRVAFRVHSVIGIPIKMILKVTKIVAIPSLFANLTLI